MTVVTFLHSLFRKNTTYCKAEFPKCDVVLNSALCWLNWSETNYDSTADVISYQVCLVDVCNTFVCNTDVN